MTVEADIKADSDYFLKGVDLDEVIKKFGDQSDHYTVEEEHAIEDLYQYIADDEDMRMWKKFAQKSLLIIVVRACQMDAKFAVKCMKKLLLHATVTYPDLFAQVDPNNLKPLIDKKMFSVVKRPRDEGPGIVVFRLKDWDPTEANIEQVVLTGGLYVLTVAKLSPEIQRKGLIVVVDIDGFKLKHARVLTSIELIIKGLRFYSAIPPLLKGVQVINSLFLFESSFNLVKWALPAHIKKLISITKKDMSYINKLMPKDMLPKEFWGAMPDKEAYFEGIEEEIMNDPMLINLIKQFQEEFMALGKLPRKKSLTKRPLSILSNCK